jgi:hypothetical protein
MPSRPTENKRLERKSRLNVFSVYSEQPDVELLMQSVAERLKRFEAGEGGSREIATLSLYPVGWEDQDTERNVELLIAQWDIDSSEIIHSTRPALGPAIITFQHAVRRLTWWFLSPIVDQISRFNHSAARVIHSLFRQQSATNQQLNEMTARLAVAERTIVEMAKRIEDLEKAQ